MARHVKIYKVKKKKKEKQNRQTGISVLDLSEIVTRPSAKWDLLGGKKEEKRKKKRDHQQYETFLGKTKEEKKKKKRKKIEAFGSKGICGHKLKYIYLYVCTHS